jgi:flagellar biosynthesis protein FlhA
MDGASRFTQRDAVASILITGINIVAGFLIGVLQHGMDLQRALQTYTVLTIGDGLVTVIPALMVSVSGAMIVTRASSESQLGAEMKRQVFSNPQPLMLAGGVLIALAAFPGLPTIPFLVLGAGVGYGGYRLQERVLQQAGAPAPAVATPKENVETVLKVEPLAVEVGLGLVKLVEGAQNSPLLRRIAAIRKQVAAEAGFLVPPVRVTDNLHLKAGEYSVLLKGAEIGRYELLQNCDLAIYAGPTGTAAPLQGVPTREPAFGIPAIWIHSDTVENARMQGYTVVDGVSVLGTHLAELVRRYGHELLSRQDAKAILDRVAEDNPRVVEDLVPKLLPLATVQKVLQNLLRERVPIRDAVTLFEALGEAAGMTKNPILLTEYARQSVRRLLVRPYLNQSGELPAFFIDAPIEQAIERAVEHGEQTSHLTLAPQRVREILDRVTHAVGAAEAQTVALTSAPARYFLRQIVESSLPNLAILSHNEIPPGVRVVSLGAV